MPPRDPRRQGGPRCPAPAPATMSLSFCRLPGAAWSTGALAGAVASLLAAYGLWTVATLGDADAGGAAAVAKAAWVAGVGAAAGGYGAARALRVVRPVVGGSRWPLCFLPVPHAPAAAAVATRHINFTTAKFIHTCCVRVALGLSNERFAQEATSFLLLCAR